jgi:hypothetical protein
MVRLASRPSFLFEHDLFGKPDSTFPDHALGGDMPVKQRVGLIVATALTIALFATIRAGAETAEGRQACTNDAFQFCSEFIPDRERVFRCLEARKPQISAACRATMPAEPAPERRAAKKLAPAITGERKTRATKRLSHAGEQLALNKHAPRTKSAIHKAPTAQRAANSAAQTDPKPLNLVPAKGR